MIQNFGLWQAVTTKDSYNKIIWKIRVARERIDAGAKLTLLEI